MKLDKFTKAYLGAALWSSTDDEEPLDENYSIGDFSESTLTKSIEECNRFRSENEADLADLEDAQSGYDFWFTRNRLGVGFWDRGYPENQAERLSDSARIYGEVYPYVGDDGKLYIS